MIAVNAGYSFSNTAGEVLFPSYFGLLRQSPTAADQVDARNPYQHADKEFSYTEGLRRIAQDPLRYIAVVASNLPAMVTIEGPLYPGE